MAGPASTGATGRAEGTAIAAAVADRDARARAPVRPHPDWATTCTIDPGTPGDKGASPGHATLAGFTWALRRRRLMPGSGGLRSL
jgi:hypothetical protein